MGLLPRVSKDNITHAGRTGAPDQEEDPGVMNCSMFNWEQIFRSNLNHQRSARVVRKAVIIDQERIRGTYGFEGMAGQREKLKPQEGKSANATRTITKSDITRRSTFSNDTHNSERENMNELAAT